MEKRITTDVNKIRDLFDLLGVKKTVNGIKNYTKNYTKNISTDDLKREEGYYGYMKSFVINKARWLKMNLDRNPFREGVIIGIFFKELEIDILKINSILEDKYNRYDYNDMGLFYKGFIEGYANYDIYNQLIFRNLLEKTKKKALTYLPNIEKSSLIDINGKDAAINLHEFYMEKLTEIFKKEWTPEFIKDGFSEDSIWCSYNFLDEVVLNYVLKTSK